MRRWLSFVMLAAAVSFASGVEAKDLDLVKDGKPRARIVVGQDACKAAQFAAEELRAYITKSTGGRLAVADSLSDDGLVDIVVGAGAIARSLGVATKGLTQDAFIIRTVGNRIIILGRDDAKVDISAKLSRSTGGNWQAFEHATLFGVYDFLEKVVGVRWYLPVDLGEVVPKHRNLTVPALDILEKPTKISRAIHVNFGADDRDDPYPKKRGGEYRGGYVPEFEGGEKLAFNRRRNLHFLRLRHNTVQIASNHSMHKLISLERFGKTHPEFFALDNNGKRGSDVKYAPHTYHCFSNSEMIHVLIEDAKAFFRGDTPESRGMGKLKSWLGIGWESPRGKVFNILQSDAFRPCQCKRCQSWKRKDVEGPGQYSDLIWNVIFRIAEAVRYEFPNCYVSGTAYGPMNTPPKRKFLPNMMVSRLAVPGPYAEFVPGGLEKEQQLIKSWIEIAGKKNIAFYHYAAKAGWIGGIYKSDHAICGSIPRAYAACYKRYGEIGQGTYMYQMSHSFPYDHLSTYVFYKYHWNPNLDIDKLLDEYYTLFYGPAAGPMRKYWQEVEQQFRKVLAKSIDTPLGPVAATTSKHEIWTVIYGHEVIGRWQAYFATADKLARTNDDPIYAKRVAYMKRNVLDATLAKSNEYNREVDLLKNRKPVWEINFGEEAKSMYITPESDLVEIEQRVTDGKLSIKLHAREKLKEPLYLRFSLQPEHRLNIPLKSPLLMVAFRYSGQGLTRTTFTAWTTKKDMPFRYRHIPRGRSERIIYPQPTEWIIGKTDKAYKDEKEEENGHRVTQIFFSMLLSRDVKADLTFEIDYLKLYDSKLSHF